MTTARGVVAPLAMALFAATLAHAQGTEVRLVDRAVARFHAPDSGGARNPHFVYQRVLAFEARLEALADPDHDGNAPYRSRHLNAALERHVAETLLASLRIDPEPTPAELSQQILRARALIVQRAGGPESYQAALRAEGIGARDALQIARRQARASLYLDRMVAPMLEPTEAELRQVHRSRSSPFSELPFEQAREPLRRWYAARRLAAALQSYYQNARGRLTLTLLGDLEEGWRGP